MRTRNLARDDGFRCAQPILQRFGETMKHEPMNWMGLALILAVVAAVAVSIHAFH